MLLRPIKTNPLWPITNTTAHYNNIGSATLMRRCMTNPDMSTYLSFVGLAVRLQCVFFFVLCEFTFSVLAYGWRIPKFLAMHPNNSTPRKNPVMMAVDLTPRFRRLNSQTRSFRENVQNGEYVFGINAFSRTIPTTKLSRY